MLSQSAVEPLLLYLVSYERASVRSWMAFADDYFSPSVYRVRMGLQRGFSEDEIQEAEEKLYHALLRLERQLEGRE